MAYLEVRDLTKIYDGVTVLDHISFDVEEGTFLSLLGPSGCGKTTTLRLIAGFHEPEAGSIKIRDSLLNPVPVHKRNIGMVFQSYALFPHMSVEQNVAYGLEQRGMDKKAIRREVGQAIEMVQLKGFEKRRPKQLSGGQQQRVALARALVIKPSLLLLDESLSALDKKLRVDMQVELRQIQKEVGITTIFVTHDQEEALTLSDRIAVMKDGRIVQLGAPDDVYERPADTFVADFLGQANFFSGIVKPRSNGIYELDMGEYTFSFAAEMEISQGSSHTITVRPEKIQISTERQKLGIPGRVKFITYAGDQSIYRIEAVGLEVKVQQQNNLFSGRRPSVGDEVFLSWPAEHSLVL
jgi:spermidine/putrescine ABC transporter ATP-binding subunit